MLVIKIGGAAGLDHHALCQDIARLWAQGHLACESSHALLPGNQSQMFIFTKTMRSTKPEFQ